ncbi:hypothetical protein [Rickettsia endosymbiont of Culicoides newsteadi]|uniref:hypothetical protein n=1 Tax=Rickettsia endosymbiont of Culicoides newsteadi TaxID=1961830 RepID=UPI000B9BE3A1|nr:hypothetical protein [Rickettsia endosymbiont of Culicoides newsteadi]OZG31879.1 hypothetical protein RiCNE_07250 [Rickettsia endosymbiont of Culicoides newsteadi]
MSGFKKTFNFTSEFIIDIERVTDINYFKSFKLIAIQNSASFYFDDNDPLVLPKFYAGLSYLTGPGDDRYDDYKGSYSFMFKLQVQKNSKISKYCYHIYHYRSYIEFAVYQLTSQGDPRASNHYHQPNDELFSDKDICSFSNLFYNYVQECMESAKYSPQPFVKYSDSNLLLFGYSRNKYFFKDYENQDIYEKKKELLKKELAKIPLVH